MLAKVPMGVYMSGGQALRVSLLMIFLSATALFAVDHGTLRVRVEDFAGMPLTADITLTELGTKKVAAITRSERKDASATVPYGRYILRIQAPGFETYERPLKVLGPTVYVRAALTVVTPDESRVVGHYVYPFIRGVVKGTLPEKGDFWAQLVPITGSQENFMAAKIDREGHFQFDGMDPGNSLLLVLDGRRVIATQQVDGATNIDVTITVP
jgi:hypothetical protein